MTAETILSELIESGIEPAVTPDGTGIEVPAGKLTDAQRAAILGNKTELIACIQESARITAELLDAAMRACDHYRDGLQAREDTRRQCLETPMHLRTDLLNSFKEHYGYSCGNIPKQTTSRGGA